MKRRLHAASVKVIKRRLYTEEVRQNLNQIDDELEVFELADHDQHLDKDDSSIYLEVEESRNNFSSSSNDNELNLSDNELDNNCNVNFEQDMEAETINNTDAEFAIILIFIIGSERHSARGFLQIPVKIFEEMGNERCCA